MDYFSKNDKRQKQSKTAPRTMQHETDHRHFGAERERRGPGVVTRQ